MAADAIQESSIGWQIQLFSHRLGQWLEWQFNQAEGDPGSIPEPMVWPAWLGSFFLWLLITGLLLLVLLLIWQVVDYILGYRQTRQAQSDLAIATEESTDLSAAEWVRRANQFAQAGQWQAACHGFYQAALQKLHDRQWVSHQPSRTDQEYLQVLTTLPHPRPAQLLINTHERSHFGNDSLSQVHVDRCRQAYREIEKP